MSQRSQVHKVTQVTKSQARKDEVLDFFQKFLSQGHKDTKSQGHRATDVKKQKMECFKYQIKIYVKEATKSQGHRVTKAKNRKIKSVKYKSKMFDTKVKSSQSHTGHKVTSKKR